jgi:hypothetical protein
MEDKFWIKENTLVDVNGRGGVACHIRPEISTLAAQNKTDVIFFWRDSIPPSEAVLHIPSTCGKEVHIQIIAHIIKDPNLIS